MTVRAPVLMLAALTLAPSLAWAVPDLTGIVVTAGAYEPSDRLSSGKFTVRNERAKAILFVMVKCAVIDDAGRTITEGTGIANDIAPGQTVEAVVLLKATAGTTGRMTCAAIDFID